MNKKWMCLSAFMTLVVSGTLHAQVLDNTNLVTGFYKANQLSMGGAWRAVAFGANAVTANPAGVSSVKAIGMSFDYYNSGFLSSQMFSGSFYDSKLNYVSMGLTFDRNDMTVDSLDVAVNQLTVAFSRQFADVVSVGSSAKYCRIQKPAGAGGSSNHFTGDLGVIVTPYKMLAFGFTLENMYSGTGDPQVPMLLGIGFGLLLGESAKITTDVEVDFSTHDEHMVNYYFGGEFQIAQGMFTRGGFGLDKVRDNSFFGVGLGLFGPKLSINFTFSERLNPVDQTYAASLELSL